MEPVESAKRNAARAAVDDFVQGQDLRVGVGSGSTVVYAAQRLGERARGPEQLRVVCVPSSFQARELIISNGLRLSDLVETPELDVTIDGADEVDPQLHCIKGGGGCQTQEMLIAAAAKKFVLIADYRKRSGMLGREWKKGVPVEVLPLAYAFVVKQVAALGGNAKLRMAVAKAGPVVTDNGGFVLDCEFGEIADPPALRRRLRAIPGVVEIGLFCGLAVRAYFGEKDGSVTTMDRASATTTTAL